DRAGAGAADQPRSKPRRRRHQDGVPEIRNLPRGVAGGWLSSRQRRPRSQGRADRAPPDAAVGARRQCDGRDLGSTGRRTASCAALPAAQPIASPTIAPHAPLETTAHHLLDDTDAAIARQTLLQVASLPDRIDTSAPKADINVPRWNFEIPFATPQGTAMAQFEISRDGGSEAVEAAKRVWRARVSLDVEPAGPGHPPISP